MREKTTSLIFDNILKSSSGGKYMLVNPSKEGLITNNSIKNYDSYNITICIHIYTFLTNK